MNNNLMANIWLSKYSSLHMSKGSSIVLISSVSAFEGSTKLGMYAVSKGALITLK